MKKKNTCVLCVNIIFNRVIKCTNNRYIIQEERSYSWTDDGDIEDKPYSKRDHLRDDRGDRYVSCLS